FGRDPADVQENIRMAPQQKESRMHPQRTPTVCQQNLHLGKIDGDIVNENRVAVTVARPVENGGSCVEHNWDSVCLGGPIDHFQFLHPVQIVVGKQKLVGRVNLDHADAEPQNLLDVGQNVLAVTGVQTAAGNQTLWVF